MIPILFDSDETAFVSNGLGRLSGATKCTVEESRNGQYELQMTYTLDGAHAADIVEGMIIGATHDDNGDVQPFRIWQREDNIDGTFKIQARHICYDLAKIPVLPFKAQNKTASAAMAIMEVHPAITCPFNFTSDIDSTGSIVVSVPMPIKDVLAGAEGSFLDTYGGEFEFYRRTVHLWEQRGEERDLTIRYGKNLTAIKATRERSEVFNAVCPYYINDGGEETSLVYLDTVVAVDENGDQITDPDELANIKKAMPLDLSELFTDTVPTEDLLIAAALDWLEKNQPWIPVTSFVISFVQLRNTEEYRDFAALQKIGLCDIVKVQYNKIGVDAPFKVIRTVYDVLQEEYTEIELGKLEQDVAGILQTTVQSLLTKIDETRNVVSKIANGKYKGGTFLSGELIYSPHIYGGEIDIGESSGGGYNFRVDNQGNVETAGGMTIKGAYAIREDNTTMGQGALAGFMGRAHGSSGAIQTYGVALCGPNENPGNITNQSIYVIVTDSGARMQAEGNSIYVASGVARMQAEGHNLRVTEDGAFYDSYEIATVNAVQNMINDALGI